MTPESVMSMNGTYGFLTCTVRSPRGECNDLFVLVWLGGYVSLLSEIMSSSNTSSENAVVQKVSEKGGGLNF